MKLLDVDLYFSLSLPLCEDADICYLIGSTVRDPVVDTLEGVVMCIGNRTGWN